MKQSFRVGVAVGVATLLFAVLLAACVAVPTPLEPAGAGVNVRTEKALVVENYITDQGTLDVTGAATIGGALTVTGLTGLNGGIAVDTSNFTVSGSTGAAATASSMGIGTWVKLGSQSAISVTAGMTITPTGTYQSLTSDGAKTCSTTTCIANGTTAGDLLILRNANASDVITIDGTGGNVECKTDKALGAQDTLTLIWNGSDWVCLALSDNS